MKCLGSIAFAAAIVVMPTAPAGADEPLRERAMIRLGGFGVRDAETLTRLDLNRAPAGLYIDFADTLGGETDVDVARLDGLYRFDDRHALGYSWYALKFTGQRTLQTVINFGDETYPIGATVNSEVRFDVYKINYQHSLFHENRAELGVLAGLHVMGVSVDLRATGTNEVHDSVTAPLPVLGVFANYRFSPRWSSYFNYQIFIVNFENRVKGGLQDLMVGLEYRLTRSVALGAAFNGFNMDLESREETTTLYVNTNWGGWMLYGSVYF